MDFKLSGSLGVACLALGAAIAVTPSPLAAQNARATVVVPDSTVQLPTDIGVRSHTNHLILAHPNGRPGGGSATPVGNTPATMYPVYLGVNYPALGGSQTIAIVDAFDDPAAENDLNTFSTQFGLPACTTANGCFKVVYAGGSQPRANCSWAQEADLDIEWAHAMAPNAKIILVEAASDRNPDLFAAVDVATQQVLASGTGEVSMSWGGSEFSKETGYDSHFQHNGVVYVAASGDTGGAVIYPSASPYVVSAGGTSLNRDANGNFVSETGWSGSGGGPSQYESQQAYQYGVSGVDATQRSTPDVSFDADPYTGVAVYDSTSCKGYVGWIQFGGTSLAAPSLAAIINRAGTFNANTFNQLSEMYANRTVTSDFYDVTSGTAGSYTAAPGWDFVTGIGSSRGLGGK